MFKGTGQFWEFSVTPPQLLVITPPPPPVHQTSLMSICVVHYDSLDCAFLGSIFLLFLPCSNINISCIVFFLILYCFTRRVSYARLTRDLTMTFRIEMDVDCTLQSFFTANCGVYSAYFNPFKPEFTIVIFIHYKPRIAVAILDL